jgi:hypothetical protein
MFEDSGGLAVFADKCNGYGVSENVTLTLAVGIVRFARCKTKIRVGILRPDVSNWRWGGRMPLVSEKNANMDVCIFFFFSARSYGCGLPLPL